MRRHVAWFRANMRYWGQPYPPECVKIGRPSRLRELHRSRMKEHLNGRPQAYLEEIRDWLLDEFDLLVSTSIIQLPILKLSPTTIHLRSIAIAHLSALAWRPLYSVAVKLSIVATRGFCPSTTPSAHRHSFSAVTLYIGLLRVARAAAAIAPRSIVPQQARYLKCRCGSSSISSVSPGSCWFDDAAEAAAAAATPGESIRRTAERSRTAAAASPPSAAPPLSLAAPSTSSSAGSTGSSSASSSSTTPSISSA